MDVSDRSVSSAACWIALIAAVVSLAVATVLFLTPESPIAGTPGALLAALASLAVAAAVLALHLSDGRHRGLFGVLSTLVLLGSLGTGFAGYMLMRPGIVASMAVCFLAVIAFLLLPPRSPLRTSGPRHAERT